MAEDSIFSDLQRRTGHDKTHHSCTHHYHHKQNRRHVSLSESLSSPSDSSSSSSFYSSSSSSPSSSSSSSSSFSSSSSTSSSSSSLSSENSSEDRCPLKKPQHSQSCTDISGKHSYFDEGDDTAPLINKRDYLNRHATKNRREREKSSQCGTTQGTLKNSQKIIKGSGNYGSFRKSKSMEALTRPKEQEGHGKVDEDEQEKIKSEARKNFMKEKIKFSAFLNEITRQVLSPMRLTTLGVTDAQRPCSPGLSSVKSGKIESSIDNPGQERSWPGSADSVSSRKYSHTSRHSSRLSQTTVPQIHNITCVTSPKAALILVAMLKLLSIAPVHLLISTSFTTTKKTTLLVTVIMKVATAQDITITVDDTTLLAVNLEAPLINMVTPTMLLVTATPPIVMIMEVATTQLTTMESTRLPLINITLMLMIITMETIMVVLITTTMLMLITLKHTTVQLIIEKVTTPTVEMIQVQFTTTKATSQTQNALLHHITMDTMEIITAHHICIATETTTTQNIAIAMEIMEIFNITALAIVITMETTTVQGVSITMGINIVILISIRM
ncbi:hypothetical protein Q8A73_023555 [Channa argus]|nr:hypothetical protein Q8A73_023555 [Channa argus]